MFESGSGKLKNRGKSLAWKIKKGFAAKRLTKEEGGMLYASDREGRSGLNSKKSRVQG